MILIFANIFSLLFVFAFQKLQLFYFFLQFSAF